MKQKAIYTDKQPSVRFQKITESKADVIVNEFIGEEIMILDPDVGTKQTMYAYWTNCFTVNPMLITEADVQNKLAYYLNYEEEKEKSLEEKIKALESENQFLSQCLMEMSEIVYA